MGKYGFELRRVRPELHPLSHRSLWAPHFQSNSYEVAWTRPNYFIHFDYPYMGPGIQDLKYILVLHDVVSAYLWLVSSKSADSETAAHSLAIWIRVFTFMLTWVCDQALHFKYEVLKILTNEHRMKHQFTMAYSPWVNVTVENCMKPVQAAYRSLLLAVA